MFALFRKPRFVFYSLLWNMATNPALNVCLMVATAYLGAAYVPAAVVGEICVFIIEAFLIRALLELSLRKALLLSLLVNAASLLVGLALTLA